MISFPYLFNVPIDFNYLVHLFKFLILINNLHGVNGRFTFSYL